VREGTGAVSGDVIDVRLAILADVRIYRDGLRELLSGRDGVAVVGVVASVEEALAMLDGVSPAVIVVHMTMADGPAAVRALRDCTPEVRVVAVAVPEAEADVIAYAEAGASGFLTHEGSLDDLVRTVRTVVRGDAACSPSMVASLLRHVSALASQRTSEGPIQALTTREREVLSLIADGLSNKEIAHNLAIELPTVKNHVHRILEKLRVARRTEAVAVLARSR
jgi:two-component system nitrate/nitrite response regulator NarL